MSHWTWKPLNSSQQINPRKYKKIQVINEKSCFKLWLNKILIHGKLHSQYRSELWTEQLYLTLNLRREYFESINEAKNIDLRTFEARGNCFKWEARHILRRRYISSNVSQQSRRRDFAWARFIDRKNCPFPETAESSCLLGRVGESSLSERQHYARTIQREKKFERYEERKNLRHVKHIFRH